MRIYSQSKYDQNDGFNWRWEVQPDYAITILSRTKDYCDIQAGQDLGTADLYFKYDFYDGASKTTSVVRWVIKYKAPPSYELKASPSGGQVYKGTKVTLTMYADGSPVYDDVTIYYTLDGSKPTLQSTKYTSAGISIKESCTLRAWGVRWQSGCSMTETYTIKQPENPQWNIKQVSAGGWHTMILNTDGTLWACGYNKNGELGDGTTTNRSTPVQVMTGVASVSAGGNSNWVSGGQTMIVKTDGTLWACGNNSYGQLGDGTTTSCSTPVQVMTGVASVSSGGEHTMIVKTDGSLWACGYNKYGQLGDGTTTYCCYPKLVMTGVASVSAGDYHTMILKTDGTLWACGRNNYGQLGDRTTTDRYTPVQVMTGVASVSAGGLHTMILKTDGWLKACGHNTLGELGNGTYTESSTPLQVMVDVESVSAGGFQTMIVKTDGTLWACGNNNEGQLGDGTTTTRGMTKQVMTNVVSVSTGGGHTMIVKNDGTLWASGYNANGELGDNTTINRNTPVQILDPSVKVTSIALDKSSMSLQPSDSETLTATVKPDNATDKTVTWSTDNTGVATVSSSGLVTAVSAGNATITCKANDGSGVQATCAVTVTSPKPDKIVLPTEATVTAGQAITLTPTVTPANAEYTLTWSSDDETVATVSQDGVVTGVKKGKTFINVETDNGKTAYCKLTVTAPEPIKIELPKNVTVTVGETITLTPTITPKDAETTLTWKSDDESVARISANGVLTGVAEGLALVTVSTSNGLTSNACKVTVEPDLSGISTVMTSEKTGVLIYSPSGQRLSAPRKGVNIVGGKKVVIK